ncbi:MAG: hypothetical protein ABSA46_20630 [Thermodesulfovibrionales bacterium]|jgi:hypothetical protein
MTAADAFTVCDIPVDSTIGLLTAASPAFAFSDAARADSAMPDAFFWPFPAVEGQSKV